MYIKLLNISYDFYLPKQLFCADMFPDAKKRRGPDKSHGPMRKRKLSHGKPSGKQSDKSPRRNAPGGQRRDKTGGDGQRKGWKQSGDGERPFGKKKWPTGKTFGGKKAGDDEKRFGGKKKFGKKNVDNTFKSKGHKGKAGFRKKGAGGKQGFKQRKGKG